MKNHSLPIPPGISGIRNNERDGRNARTTNLINRGIGRIVTVKVSQLHQSVESFLDSWSSGAISEETSKGGEGEM